ncbi:carbohydrate kinase (thermoresistant glucokinase family) [Agromyces terreus]|uniref:Gluconokinase n=1 Tax=Agromyces terreus TaxID=424795 RepID=A0A9X2KCW8_9MICO|nr:gluconokinase [Agromyces terreus]MCP2371801.1 carbohydrate kinase (thermoresistant glucokinase family) [Agromyces terreus]
MDAAVGTDSPPAVVVMGVAGAGKSTLAIALAERLGAVFVEADDLHSAEAKAQMAAGIPLTDEDRWPWLARVAARARDEHADRHPVVVSCSALKRSYREFLTRVSETGLAFVHVHGSETQLAERIGQRTGHFMPATMLASQIATLEPLADDEHGFVVDLELALGDAADRALDFLRRNA